MVVKNGIEVEPNSEYDCWMTNSCLRKKNVEFLTFELKSKKPLKVLPHEIYEEGANEDLENNNYNAQNHTDASNK